MVTKRLKANAACWDSFRKNQARVM